MLILENFDLYLFNSICPEQCYFKCVETVSLFFQINWASTESQMEECMMKGREKVGALQNIFTPQIPVCIIR